MNPKKEFENLLSQLKSFKESNHNKQIIKKISTKKYAGYVLNYINKIDSAVKFDALLKVFKALDIKNKKRITQQILQENINKPLKIAYICLNLSEYLDNSMCMLLGKALDSYEEIPFVASSIISTLTEIKCKNFISRITQIRDKYSIKEPLISRAAQIYLEEII